MSKKYILVAFFAILNLGSYSQRPTLELVFTAVNNTDWVQLDSIKIMNRTQGNDTVLYWPDTVLSILFTGMQESIKVENIFRLFQNYPNPVAYDNKISLCVPEKDKVSLLVTDVLGNEILKYERVLDRGCHSFRFTPGSGNLNFVTAQWRGKSSTIKILHISSGSNMAGSIEYLGCDLSLPHLKATGDIQNFTYFIGDMLLYKGYANSAESGILDSPEESKIHTFQFAAKIPCPGVPTVEYQGQVYNTIQIFSQCWLKENLNVGEMIDGTMEPSNNGIIEKYCYNNEPDSCSKYGGLYQWWESMQYTTQGADICPPGWRMPTDEEWKVLEGVADSHYKIGDPEWDIPYELRGLDAGTNLKTTGEWNENGNGTDLFVFSGLPGGYRHIWNGNFIDARNQGYWWSSNGWIRSLGYNYPTSGRHNYGLENGFSVRCIKD